MRLFPFLPFAGNSKSFERLAVGVLGIFENTLRLVNMLWVPDYFLYWTVTYVDKLLIFLYRLHIS